MRSSEGKPSTANMSRFVLYWTCKPGSRVDHELEKQLVRACQITCFEHFDSAEGVNFDGIVQRRMWKVSEQATGVGRHDSLCGNFGQDYHNIPKGSSISARCWVLYLALLAKYGHRIAVGTPGNKRTASDRQSTRLFHRGPFVAKISDRDPRNNQTCG